MNGFGFNSNGYVRQFLDKPIATYIHNSNKEVIVSAVDVATNTFTSVAHGLINGDTLYPIMNIDAGAIFPIDKYPVGITYKTAPGYYVVGKTADTFQLSLTNGGAAIVLTENANMDLTKWHFEKFSVTINFIGLNASRYLLRVRGRSIRSGGGTWVLPNSISETYWAKNGSTVYVDSSLFGAGDISMDMEILVDYTNLLTIKAKGIAVMSNTAIANTVTLIDKMLINPTRREGIITSIMLSGFELANGTTVEVYKA